MHAEPHHSGNQPKLAKICTDGGHGVPAEPGVIQRQWKLWGSRTLVNLALHLSRVAKLSTSFGRGKGGKITAARCKVTLRDPIWHVISDSGVVISITNCHIGVYFLLREAAMLARSWGS